MDERVVLFVCPHGAAKSRIAAAWFNELGIVGWSATSAGVSPQEAESPRPDRLLAGTGAAAWVEHGRPRGLDQVPGAELIVAIDCAGEVPDAKDWELDHDGLDMAMCDEIRYRVAALARSLTGSPEGG